MFELKSNEEALGALHQGMVLGGTAWLWARDDAVETVDYLFVDEAGQMSLVHVLAAARCAKNLVLLGDPQQLEQPQRGAHPEGSEIAALDHVLDGSKTLPPNRGLFLDVTWRLHPEICAFTSEIFYEGRLRSLPGLERQAVIGKTPLAGSGLVYVPVDHQGNQTHAPEEVGVIRRLVSELLGVARWVDAKGVEHSLEASDILVVAPYNAQVGALVDSLPDGTRVGTVDKFQGAAGTGRHLLHDEFNGRRRAAGNELSLQPESTERRHQPGQVFEHSRGVAQIAGTVMSSSAANALGERALPLSGAGARSPFHEVMCANCDLPLRPIPLSFHFFRVFGTAQCAVSHLGE